MKRFLITLATVFAITAPVAYDLTDAAGYGFHTPIEVAHQAEKGLGHTKHFNLKF